MQLPKLLFMGALVLLSLTPAAFAACNDNTISIRGDWGQARFTIEIADSPETRAQGLMHRKHMAKSAGMLFVYEYPQRVAFWMKNTLIPLDMIFVGQDGVVSHIHENAIPGDLTHIPGGESVFAVLEINAGIVRDYGISVGSQMQHKIFPAESVIWSC